MHGLLGVTHGGGRVLTVLCADGAGAARAALEPAAGVEPISAPGDLPRYRERRAGALAALAARHRIEIVDRQRWAALKAAYGERAYR